MKKFNVIVIGGGASGLMAAGKAAQSGASVLLLEKMKHPARKLRISGKGRCNLTNTAPMSDFIKHIGKNGRFLRPAFAEFFSKELILFIETLGLKTIEERGGRIFPVCQDAKQVVDALHKWVLDNGVTLLCESEVKQLMIEENAIKGVKLLNQTTYAADSVIIATGGASYPATGSTGDGYRFAKEAGHQIIPIRPMLVPIITKGNIAKRLEGLSLKNVNVNVWVNDKKCAHEFGEMVFTDDGMSGPIILSLSRLFIDDIKLNKKVIFSIDLKPALDDQKLDARILRDINENGKMLFSSLAKLWLPTKLVSVFIDLINIPYNKLANQINAEERKKIRLWLKNFKFEVIGNRSFAEAIITAGGVDVTEINPMTLESKLVKNLYFAGEVMDLDADTGGYNLQIAFSTGWLAGKTAAKID